MREIREAGVRGTLASVREQPARARPAEADTANAEHVAVRAIETVRRTRGKLGFNLIVCPLAGLTTV